MTDEQWNVVLDVTLNGTFRCTRAALNHMYANGHGVIVNNASVIGWRAQAEQAHYAAAKAGVMALTRCAAIEAGRARRARQRGRAEHRHARQPGQGHHRRAPRRAHGARGVRSPRGAVGGRQRDRVPGVRLLGLHDRRDRGRSSSQHPIEGGNRGVRCLRRHVPPEPPSGGGGDRAGRAARRARRRAGGRPLGLQVRVGHRAPLPRRVLAPLGQRGVDGVRARDHRAHPHRLGDHQHHAAGLPPRARRREGGDARPARAGSLRVRHRARVVVGRGASASASTRWTSPATCTTRRCPRS